MQKYNLLFPNYMQCVIINSLLDSLYARNMNFQLTEANNFKPVAQSSSLVKKTTFSLKTKCQKKNKKKKSFVNVSECS